MARMTANLTGGLRLTVLGSASAAPHRDSPAAGFLVEWEATKLLLDVGQGVIRVLQEVMDPVDLTAVVVGHMHADHYLDLAGLRYLYPWGEPADQPLPVHLPPGGRKRIDALATAISERAGFFDAAYRDPRVRPGPAASDRVPDGHLQPGAPLRPGLGDRRRAPNGARLVYTGDTGPTEALVAFAREADLLLVEATLRHPSQDDPERGHLTAEEAIDLARRADVRSAGSSTTRRHAGSSSKPCARRSAAGSGRRCRA